MRRRCWKAQSFYFGRWFHALHTENLLDGSTQKLRISADVSGLKRGAGGRWLCTALMSCDGESTNVTGGMVEEMGLNSFFPTVAASDVVHNAALGYGNEEPCLSGETDDSSDVVHNAALGYGNEEPCLSAETDDSLVEPQSKVIRKILDDGDWDLHMPKRLRPFVNILSPALVARVLNQVWNVKTAQSFFDWAACQDGYKHNVFVYNALIMKLGLARKFDAIEELLKKMRSEKCDLTSTTFAIIIQSYGKACLLEECWQTFGKAEHMGVKPDVRMYTSLLRILFNAGKVTKAKQLVSRMQKKNVEFDLHVWFAIIQGLCKNKMVTDAQNFFDQMLSSGCTPNAHVYNAIILGFCECGNPKKALSYFEMMQKEGCKPDVYTYNTLIQSYCGLHMFAEAEGLVSEMRNDGCEPNQVTFNILLQHVSQQGLAKEACDLFRRMQEEGWVDVVSYRIYSSLLRNSGKIETLFSLAEDLFSRNGTTYVEVCNAILQYYCDKGDLPEAAKYLDETFVRVSTPNGFSFVTMINAYCNSGDVDAAHALLSGMVERGCTPRTRHYDLVIMGLCKHSRASEALHLFKEMLVKGVESSPRACDCLLAELSDAGMVEEVRYVCEHITLKRYCVSGLSLVSFMKCLRNSDQFEVAKALLKEMLHRGCCASSRSFRCCVAYLFQGEVAQVEKYFRKQTPNIVEYSLKIGHACRTSWPDAVKGPDVVKALFAEMKELGFTPSLACYSKVIICLSKCKDTVSESLDLFEELLERGLSPGDALPSYLLDFICKRKQPDLVTRFCRIAIAKRLTLRKASAKFLLKQRESEVKKLFVELTEAGCLAEVVPTYNRGTPKLKEKDLD